MPRNNRSFTSRCQQLIDGLSPGGASANGPWISRTLTVIQPVVLMMIALIWARIPAKGELWISPSAKHSALWQRIYDEFPSAWKTEQAIAVLELSDGEMEAYLTHIGVPSSVSRADSRSRVDGCYQKRGNEENDVATIRLCQGESELASSLVFAHEYGHYIWDRKLTIAQRRSFIRIWRLEKRAHRLITDYAADCCEEGFSEAVSYYLLKPAALLDQSPASSSFVSALVRGGSNSASANAKSSSGSM